VHKSTAAISVIMPVRNAESTIGAAVKCIVRQAYQNAPRSDGLRGLTARRGAGVACRRAQRTE
jgi:hypothetical protein